MSALFALQVLKIRVMIMILIILSEKDDSCRDFQLNKTSKIYFLLNYLKELK